jgi:hypothetical protein
MRRCKKLAQISLMTLLVAVAVGGMVFSVTGCAQAVDGKTAVNESVPARETAPLENQEQRLSYALGMVLGNQFRQQAVMVDLDFYLQGLEDALSGQATRMTDIEARDAVNRLQRDLQRKQLSSPEPAGRPTGIEVSFKLDPRLTRSMYMGDRWVSPPTFTIVQEGREAVIEARAHGTNAKGKSLQINPEWTPEDPEMLEIVPDTGGEVRIMVHSAGRTSLKVEVPGISKTYTVLASYLDDSIQVEISQ